MSGDLLSNLGSGYSAWSFASYSNFATTFRFESHSDFALIMHNLLFFARAGFFGDRPGPRGCI